METELKTLIGDLVIQVASLRHQVIELTKKLEAKEPSENL